MRSLKAVLLDVDGTLVRCVRRNQGVRAVAVRSGGHPGAALAQAVAIYDDAADLLTHFESSTFDRESSR